MELEDATEWEPFSDVGLPIFGDDIAGFECWLFGNGFRLPYHGALDFDKYIRDKRLEENLPPQTPVRTIADGVVHKIHQGHTGRLMIYKKGKPEPIPFYLLNTIVRHNDNGLASGYCHMKPAVEVGQEVKRGEVIGHLLTAEETIFNSEVLIHLHFAMGRCNPTENSDSLDEKCKPYSPLIDFVDPLKMIPGIMEHGELYRYRGTG